MRMWFSAAELAPILGVADRKTVHRRALREHWLSELRPGNGGLTLNYHFDSLPEAAQQTLRKHYLRQGFSQSQHFRDGLTTGARAALAHDLTDARVHNERQESLQEADALPKGAQRRMDEKLSLLRHVDDFAKSHGLPISRAEEAFAKEYSAGFAIVGSELKAAIPRVSARSLREWRISVKRDGITALAGAYGNRKGAGALDVNTEMRDLLLGILVERPHSRAAYLRDALVVRFRDQRIPSHRTIGRWVARWKSEHKELFTAIRSPDRWKHKHMVAFGSASDGITRLNQRWEMDSTPADVMLTDGRHAVIGVIDVYSRRLRLLVTKTSRATAIAALMRRAILEWGVPEEIKTDNGQDYTSNHIERVVRSLDIEQILCKPFSPWEKPHIERALGTFSHGLVEHLDGFIGHNVAEAQAIRARQSFADKLIKRNEAVDIRMSAEEFQRFADQWVDLYYMRQPHEGLAKRAPIDVVAAWPERVRKISNERALDILLAPAGVAAVQKKGIQKDNAFFIAAELEAFVGQRVEIREDERDLGRIYVFGGEEQAFICIAECPERTGIDRREVAIRARERQKARIQQERAALRAVARKAKTDDLVTEILEDRAKRAGKLAMLPKRGEAHDTSDLRAAANAVAELNAPQRTSADAISAERHREVQAELAAKQIPTGINNTLGARRLQAALAAPRRHVGEWESVFQRVVYTLEQSLFRPLTDEERQYLAFVKADKRERVTYKSALELVEQKHGRKVEGVGGGT
jgi:putative transposase